MEVTPKSPLSKSSTNECEQSLALSLRISQSDPSRLSRLTCVSVNLSGLIQSGKVLELTEYKSQVTSWDFMWEGSFSEEIVTLSLSYCDTS